MSDPILPLLEWPEGISQARVPANDNALRVQALVSAVVGVSNDGAGAVDGDVFIVGNAPTADLAAMDENDIALYVVDPVTSVGSWYPWAPVPGIRMVVNDVRKLFNGTAWIDDPAGSGGGGGSGDVVGPASSVDSRVALFDGASGKLLKQAGKTFNESRAQSIVVACSDETTNLTTGTAKVTFRMPYAFTLTAVRASLTAAQGAGSIFTVDINEGGTTILSTKLTIDNTELTSTTAATPPVISDASLADDAEITIDIDQIGTSGAKGLKVYLIGYPT